MYDAQAVQHLIDLINKRSDGCLIESKSIDTIDSYLESLEKIELEEDWEIKKELQIEVLTLFNIKREGQGYYESYKRIEELKDPTLSLIVLRMKYEYKNLIDINVAKSICKELKTISLNLKCLIERTQQCLKDEKFKPDLKPIVLLTSKFTDSYYAKTEILESVIFIVNQHSFIRLTISAQKVEERIVRAIRKDIIDIVLKDKDLIFHFHSIRESITLNLNSYKEAKNLQEAIHEIRNSPMFQRDKR